MAENEWVCEHFNQTTRVDGDVFDYELTHKVKNFSEDVAESKENDDKKAEHILPLDDFSHLKSCPATHIGVERINGSERQESARGSGVLNWQPNEKEKNGRHVTQSGGFQLVQGTTFSRCDNTQCTVASGEGSKSHANFEQHHDETELCIQADTTSSKTKHSDPELKMTHDEIQVNKASMTIFSRIPNEQILRGNQEDSVASHTVHNKDESDSALNCTEPSTTTREINENDMTDSDCQCISNDSGADIRSDMAELSDKKHTLCRSKIELVECLGNIGENVYYKETSEKGIQCDDDNTRNERIGPGESKVKLLSHLFDHPIVEIRSDSFLFCKYDKDLSSFQRTPNQDWDFPGKRRSPLRGFGVGGLLYREMKERTSCKNAKKPKEREEGRTKRKQPDEFQHEEEVYVDSGKVFWYDVDDDDSEDGSIDNENIYRNCLPFREAAHARSVTSSVSSESQMRSIFAFSPIFSMFQSALDITNSCDPSVSDEDNNGDCGSRVTNEYNFRRSSPFGSVGRRQGIGSSHLMNCSQNLTLGRSISHVGSASSPYRNNRTPDSVSPFTHASYPNRRGRSANMTTKLRTTDSFPKVKFSDSVSGNVPRMDVSNSANNVSGSIGDQQSTNMEQAPNSTTNNCDCISARCKAAASTFIGEYLYELWKNECLCDVRIRVDNKSFLAHKIVLAAFSDVFCPSEPMPNPTLMVDVPNTTSAAVFQILQYLYTSEMNITDETLEAILSAALFLGVTDVVDLVKDILSHPTKENIMGYMDIADRMQIPFTVQQMPHLFREYLQDIWESNLFKSLSERDLRLILTDQNIKVDSETDLIVALVKWIEGDFENRQHLTPSLLKHINFVRIEPDALARTTNEYPHIFQNTECQSILAEVYKSFAILESSTDPLDTYLHRGISRAADTTRQSRRASRQADVFSRQSTSLSRLTGVDTSTLGRLSQGIGQGASHSVGRQSQQMNRPLSTAGHSQIINRQSFGMGGQSQRVSRPSLGLRGHSQSAYLRHSEGISPKEALDPLSPGNGRLSHTIGGRASGLNSVTGVCPSVRKTCKTSCPSPKSCCKPNCACFQCKPPSCGSYPPKSPCNKSLLTNSACADCKKSDGVCNTCSSSFKQAQEVSSSSQLSQSVGNVGRQSMLNESRQSTRFENINNVSSAYLLKSTDYSSPKRSLNPKRSTYEQDTNATLIAINDQFRRASRLTDIDQVASVSDSSKKRFRIAEHQNTERVISSSKVRARSSGAPSDRTHSLSPREYSRLSSTGSLRASSVPRSRDSSRTPPSGSLRVPGSSRFSEVPRQSGRLSAISSPTPINTALRISSARRGTDHQRRSHPAQSVRISSAPPPMGNRLPTLKTIDTLDEMSMLMSASEASLRRESSMQDKRKSRSTIPVVLKTPHASVS